MQSTITARGQTVVPAAIRNQLHLGPADRLEWILDDGGIRVVPVRSNPIDVSEGKAKVAQQPGSPWRQGLANGNRRLLAAAGSSFGREET